MQELQAEQKGVKLSGILECKFLSKTRTVLLSPFDDEKDLAVLLCCVEVVSVLGSLSIRVADASERFNTCDVLKKPSAFDVIIW
jgi:hypothetical protein